MFNAGSNSKPTCVALAEPPAAVDLQSPLNTSFCLPEVVQLRTSLLAMLVSVKEGPVSEDGVLVEPGISDAGGAWYCLSHFSSRHDWYLFLLSVHAAVATSGAGARVVLNDKLGRLPVLVVFGVQ